MDNSLHTRGGEKLSAASNTMDLIVSRLANRVDVGAKSEVVIKKNTQVLGSAGT